MFESMKITRKIKNPYIPWVLSLIVLLWIASPWLPFDGSSGQTPMRVDYRVPVECNAALPLATLGDARCFAAKIPYISSQLSAQQTQAGYDGWDITGGFFKASAEYPQESDYWAISIISVGTQAPVYGCMIQIAPDGSILEQQCHSRN